VLRRGGLKVHTTIEPKMQEAARKAIAGQLPFPTDPSSAIVSIDPANGYIRAMASSGTYRDRTFNLAAQGHRQPGSSFKTMVLTTAIRLGVNPNTTTYTSKPLNLNVPGYGPWQVKTYSNTYGGTMNLVQATLKSDNTVYAQLILDVGPKEVCKTAHMLGITTQLDCLPAEGLGGLRLGVSPLEMADAYATLADGGVRHRPEAITKVEFPDGKSDDLGKPKSKRVISDGVAAEVTKILKQNVQSGTGTHANIGCPAAGKTGTTDNFNDAWFVGYTPHLASSVWVGYPNALTEMRSVHGIEVAGGTFPAQIWHDYMNVAKGSDCSDFPPATTPVHYTPFYGKFSHSGSRGYGGTTYSSPNIGGGTNGGTTGRYNPQFYEAPPQPEPKVAPPPSPKNQKLNSAPTGPTPGNGRGNGNGNGNGGR
jgi:penicillin-binding protein 1A